MATDLTWMIAEIQDHGFTDTSTSRLTGFINDAYYDVCSRSPWPFLEKVATPSTVAGTATITMPSDFRATLSLVCDTAANPILLLPERLEVINKKFNGSLTQQGRPSLYYFLADAIYLYPVPDAIYALQHQYLAAPLPLSVGTDVPLIPERHRRVIVLGALVYAYRMEDDPETAQVFENQFEKRIMEMTEDLWRKQYDRPDMIYDVFATDDYWT